MRNRQKYTGRMTEGNEFGHIFRFMIPLLIGNLFQQLYMLVDSMVVGRFVSATALGAVGSVSSIVNLFLALCVGLSGGVNVMTAQYYGAENEDGLKRTIGNSIYVTVVSGGLMSVCSVCFASQILHAMNMPKEGFTDALTYMLIMCGSMVITAGYNTVSAILRALGDSKTPLYLIMISSVINVILDILFVTQFDLGVAGVAWATVIAQAFSLIGVMLIAVRKNSCFRLKGRHIKPSGFIVKRICSMGIPLAVQNAMNSITGVISQSVVNSFGSVVMSAYTAGGRVEQLVWQPYGTMGVALSTFAGQNVGAGKHDRVKRGCRQCVRFALGFALLMMLVMFFGGKTIIGLFVKEDGVIAIGAAGLAVSSLSYFFLGLVYIYKATLNGAGDAGFSLWSGVVEVAARLVFLFALTSIPAVGYWGIWITPIFTTMIAAAMCICRFYGGKWKKKVVVS